MPVELKVFGPVVLMTVAHQLTAVDCRRLRAETDAALQRGRAVRIDLTGVPRLGGDALEALKQLGDQTREAHGDLRIMSIAPTELRELQAANIYWLLRSSPRRRDPT